MSERMAKNSPIQGTAADIIKIAMLNVEKRLLAEKLDARLLLQIHDELLVEVRKDEEERVREVMKEEMEKAAVLSVPLIVSISSGQSLFEAK
jgi:DNA polymerase-1